jgi:asparagine synthase (glutamine-hydrolysing)
MCGIFGWLGQPPPGAAAFTARAQRLLAHRGPDAVGGARGESWELGFRRLAILDLTPSGHQPMSTPDGRYQLVLNGEIYNYVELRGELERSGVRFAGTSDTEVALRLLERDGAAAVQRFNGMFALCLVDTRERTFLLARDRLGVKPLYLHSTYGHLRFASELKALLAWPGASRTVDPAAVVEYLALGYVSSDRCIAAGYEKLPPGHVLEGRLDVPGASVPRPYWSVEPDDHPATAVDLDALHALLEDAVRIRLRSDVPVGVFLSGGLDSGLVAALAGSTARSAGVDPPLALTVGFLERSYDETALAATTARSAGLAHRTVLQATDALGDLDVLAWHYDEPFGDSSALPSLALARAAAQVGTVFLSGDGGDEAFGGYRRYIEALRYLPLRRVPVLVGRSARALAAALPPTSSLRHRVVKASAPDAGFAATFDAAPDDPALGLVLGRDLREHLPAAGAAVWRRWIRSSGRPLTARQRALDYRLYLPDDILVKVDRASMAHSLEVRSPFLDYRLVEWAARLPQDQLVHGGRGKLPLRELGRRLLAPEVLNGPKRGFAVPMDDWLRRPEGERVVKERLLGPAAMHAGYWDTRGVARVMAAHRSGRTRSFAPLLWRLLVLQAWHQQYIDDTFLAGPPPRGAARAEAPAAASTSTSSTSRETPCG